MVVFFVERPIAVTQQDVNDILTTAFEGGVNYWCSRAVLIYPSGPRSDVDSDTYYAPHGFVWMLYDANIGKPFNTNEYPTFRNLTIGNLQEGMQKWCRTNNLSIEDIDADAADQIVQLAVFGEIVFE